MKHYTRVLARVDLDAVEYNIEMMKKNIQKDTFVAFCPFRIDNHPYLFFRCYVGIRG